MAWVAPGSASSQQQFLPIQTRVLTCIFSFGVRGMRVCQGLIQSGNSAVGAHVCEHWSGHTCPPPGKAIGSHRLYFT